MTNSTLKKLGFLPASDVVQQRQSITMILNALEKAGKTRFWLTAPKPIAVMNFDREIDKVMLDELDINKSQDLLIKTIEVFGDDAEDIWMNQWVDFKQSYYGVLNDESIRSVCVDTADQMYELSRLANFGRLAQVPSFKYSIVNTELKLMIKKAKASGKNVIWVNRLGKEYAQNKKGEDSWTGNWTPKGWGGAQFEFEVISNLFIDDEGYNCQIYRSAIRQSEVMDEVLLNDDINFAQLAAKVTGTSLVDWL